jgi:hypothetical protein
MCPKRLVGLRGLEPPPLAGHDPKSCASASSATSPALFRCYDSTKTPAAMTPRRAPMTTVEQCASRDHRFQHQPKVRKLWCLRGVPKLCKRPDLYKSPEAAQSPAGEMTTRSSLREPSKWSVNRSPRSLTISSVGLIRSRMSLPSKTRVTLLIVRVVL